MATAFLVVKNRAYSKLAAAITDVATTLTVTAGEGANFPSTYPFHITIEDEIVSCTNRSTDSLTVVRAQQGTTGAAHANKSYAALNITAKSVTDLNTAVNRLETDVPTYVATGDMRYASAAATGAILTIGATDTILSVQGGVPTWRTPANILTDLSGQAGADFSMNTNKITSVTDPSSAQDAATKNYVDTTAVLDALFDAHTILYAVTDNTPVALTVAASRIVGRKASGNIAAMTGAETLALLTGANLDVGAFDVRGATITADGLTSGRVVVAGASGVLSDDADFTFSVDTLTVTKIGAFEATGAINFANQNMTNVDIDSGDIAAVTFSADNTWSVAQTGMTLTSPTINGTIATTGLTLPAITLGGLVTGGGQIFSNLGRVYINEIANADMTMGLTITQATSVFNQILAFKQADVAHGITSVVETDTYADMKQTGSGGDGGLQIRGFSEDVIAFQFQGIYTNDNTVKSTAGRAALEVDVYKKSGTSVGAPGADANIFAVRIQSNTTLLIVDKEGDLWINGNVTTDGGTPVAGVNVIGSNIRMADTVAITTGILDDDYFTIGAVDNDTQAITELLRFVGAVNPYTRVTNGLYLVEQAAALDDGAGLGQLWVKNTTPNELWFTDDDGSDKHLAVFDADTGEMIVISNQTATIETTNTPHAFAGLSTGDVQDFSFVAGITGAITLYEDYSGTVANAIRATCVGHGLVTNDIITIRGTVAPNDYNGIWQITRINDDTFYFVEASLWNADAGASDFEMGAYLLAGTGTAGEYDLEWNSSVSEGGGAQTVLFNPVQNTTILTKASSKRKFANNDVGSISGGGHIAITVADRIWFAHQSDGTGDLTVNLMNLRLSRLA